jgi:hypothetical protein
MWCSADIVLVAISTSFSYEAVVLLGTNRCGVVHCYFPVSFFFFFNFVGSSVFVFQCSILLKVSFQLVVSTSSYRMCHHQIMTYTPTSSL